MDESGLAWRNVGCRLLWIRPVHNITSSGCLVQVSVSFDSFERWVGFVQ